MSSFLWDLAAWRRCAAHSCTRSGPTTGVTSHSAHTPLLSVLTSYCVLNLYANTIFFFTIISPVLRCPIISFLLILYCSILFFYMLFLFCLQFHSPLYLKVLLTGSCDSVARRAPLGSVKSGSRHRRLTGDCSKSSSGNDFKSHFDKLTVSSPSLPTIS